MFVDFFFFKQKTAYEMRISDWSSDVCSSDLTPLRDTDAVVRHLQEGNDKDPRVQALYGVSGTGTRLDASPTESGENIAKLTVVMKDGGNEKVEAAHTGQLRGPMGGEAGAQVDVSPPEPVCLSTPPQYSRHRRGIGPTT